MVKREQVCSFDKNSDLLYPVRVNAGTSNKRREP